MGFIAELNRELLRSLPNEYNDNWDSERFGKESRGLLETFRSMVKRLMLFFGWLRYTSVMPDKVYSGLLSRLPEDEKTIATYNRLADEVSRQWFVKLIAYRILGHRKVKLPTNTGEYWKARKLALRLCDTSRNVPARFENWNLPYANLNSIGFPITAHTTPGAIASLFIEKQYSLRTEEVNITVEAGDTVLDCGGCWGDTALLFAYQAGPKGRVYTFEFMPDNISILMANMEMNPILRDRINLVQHPLWSTSGVDIAISGTGPGAKIDMGKAGSEALRCKTIAIDDYVERNSISKVDFIKMDIEGAELESLRGAERTLRRHRPKLAISIYHRSADFVDIPSYLESLNVSYKYFIRHHTIYGEETVLYAICNFNQ